ncbi:MAG: 4Fe-4S dicluster domain-containing protein [Candidatus Omnitrophota bacterium]
MKKLYYDVEKCQACKTCEIACCVGHSLSKDILKAIFEEPLSLPRIKVKGKLPYLMSCRHCDEPLCVDACIANCLAKDKKTGLVLHDKDKCVGCWMCVMVCPYAAIRPDLKTKIPLRCDMCKDLDMPQCVKSCPVEAIIWAEEEEIKGRKICQNSS